MPRLPPSGRLSPGLVPTPFYEQWGIGKNGVLEFISNFEMLNGLLQWNRRSSSTPASTSSSGDRRRDDPVSDHRQDDPLERGRRARPGLRAHRSSQGLRRAPRRPPARPAQRPAPGRHRSSGSSAASSADDPDRDGVLTHGRGQDVVRLDHGARLRRRAGFRPRRRRRLRLRQPDHRRPVHAVDPGCVSRDERTSTASMPAAVRSRPTPGTTPRSSRAATSSTRTCRSVAEPMARRPLPGPPLVVRAGSASPSPC